MAFPTWIIALLAPFLQEALKGDDQNQTTETTETSAKAPFDPAYSMMSPTVISGLLQNYGRLSGAGMPGGQGIDMGFANDVIKQLKSSWPDILAANAAPAKTAKPLVKNISRGSLRG